MFLGLALMIGGLLWARKRRREAHGVKPDFRGPRIMGGLGIVIFLFYLWLITYGALQG